MRKPDSYLRDYYRAIIAYIGLFEMANEVKESKGI
jgi:hypothetical protein